MSAVTFVLRFDSTLQLNVHFHVLVPDGAFDHDGVFVAEEASDDHDVREILVRAGCKVIALLHRFLSRPPPHQGALRSPADARTLGQNEEILGRARHRFVGGVLRCSGGCIWEIRWVLPIRKWPCSYVHRYSSAMVRGSRWTIRWSDA